MTPDRLPTRQMPAVADDYENFLDHMEELETTLTLKAKCPIGHSLGVSHESLEWPAEEGPFLLGPTPVYKDPECQTTFVSPKVLSFAEESLKVSVKSPDSYQFSPPDGVSPLIQQ